MAFTASQSQSFALTETLSLLTSIGVWLEEVQGDRIIQMEEELSGAGRFQLESDCSAAVINTVKRRFYGRSNAIVC